MAKTKLDNINQIQIVRPLYAYVGVTDLAVERVRDLMSDAQTRANRAQKRLDDLDPNDLREQAARKVSDRVEALGKAAEERQEAAEKRISAIGDDVRSIPSRITGFVSDNVEAATETYVDLAKRGESLVSRIRKQESTKQTVSSAKTTSAKAKTTTTQAQKTASAATTSAKDGGASTAKTAKTAAKSTQTSAKKSAGATKSTAKGGATKTTNSAKTAAKKTGTTAKKSSAPSSATATVTAAKTTASNAAQATGDAAAKVGD